MNEPQVSPLQFLRTLCFAFLGLLQVTTGCSHVAQSTSSKNSASEPKRATAREAVRRASTPTHFFVKRGPGILEATQASASLHQGTVLSSPPVHVVFWGNAWNSPAPDTTTGTARRDRLLSITKNILSDAKYFSGAKTYGDIGTARFAGAVAVASSPAALEKPEQVWHDAPALFSGGDIPAPSSDNEVYVLMLPDSSDTEDGGYHTEINVTRADGNDTLAQLAVINTRGSTFDDVSDTISHELVEDITDPHFDAVFGHGGREGECSTNADTWKCEIADMCANADYGTDPKTPQGDALAQYWVDSTKSCYPAVPDRTTDGKTRSSSRAQGRPDSGPTTRSHANR